MDGLITIALIAVLVIGACYDLATRRIPNDLTIPGILLGLVLRAIVSAQSGNADALLSGLAGAGIAFALTFPLFAARALGGGDVKLLLAAGTLLGASHILPAILLSAVVGGVMGFAQAWRRGVILPVFLGCRDLVVYCATLGRSGARPVLEDTYTLSIPYGVAIAAGSMTAWFL